MRRFPAPWIVEQIPGGYKVKLNDGREAGMRKLLIGMTGASLVLLGFLGGNAEATSLTGAITVQPRTNHSLVKKAVSCRTGYHLCLFHCLRKGFFQRHRAQFCTFCIPNSMRCPI